MIAEELQDIIDEADMKMDDAIQFLKKNFPISERVKLTLLLFHLSMYPIMAHKLHSNN